MVLVMRVCAIGDLHNPYSHPNAIDFIVEQYNLHKCDTVVCLGDDVDLAPLSQYKIDGDTHNTNDELTLAAENLNRLRNALAKRCNYLKPIRVCIGNHNERLFKKALDAGIPAKLLRTIKSVYNFPKDWNYVERFRVDGVWYTHGTQLSGVHAFTHAVYGFQSSVIYGHLHHDAGIKYVRTMSDNQYFAMNVGCLIDPTRSVFRYDKRSRTKPIISLGLCLDGLPILIPMEER